MSDENEFIIEGANNENSNSNSGEDVTIIEEVVESPQTQESFEIISEDAENEDVDKPIDSENLPVEESIDEVRIDNDGLIEDKSKMEPPPAKNRKRGKRKTRKLIDSSVDKNLETLEISKVQEKAIEELRNHIAERIKINEQKLDRVISSIHPIEKHIHSSEKQIQSTKQIQVQVKQIQKQLQQMEKQTKNLSSEIMKKIDKQIKFKLQKMPVRDIKPNKSKTKRIQKTKTAKKSKTTKRKRI
jgi:hypothetical protein